MIIRAKHNCVIYPFFRWYAAILTRWHFRKIIINSGLTDSGKSILLLANHISWWDGFWASYVNDRIFRRKFYFMMQEEQLLKHSFFIRAGGFSVRKGSRSVLETIDYASQLLKHNENLVLVFPQGRINSLYENNIEFEGGISRIIRKTPGDLQIVFMVSLVDFFSHRKPTLFIYLKEFRVDSEDFKMPETAYNAFYRECVMRNIENSEGQ